MIRTFIVQSGTTKQLDVVAKSMEELGWKKTGNLHCYRTITGVVYAQLLINSTPEGLTVTTMDQVKI